ncbi:neocarzinostatin apoprotein domain-containing protein [Embleya scabrispora]|uniref:neocarzinostatin apoprotein domain-containing protein n=1 Tax=Embleya scabrispora TaxID=159449 RepID=UPI0003A095EE|nr:neocarzinostatin apoprotein domain-containing protein [Embleya scabrispora]MYS84265.1 LPXTG cell wall anchor domain-containing protein [Streptomyces sp. SID5474]
MRTSRTAAAVAATAIAGLGVLAASPASAADAPTISLSKATGIAVGGEEITVTGKNFKPGKGVYIAQTVAKPAGGVPTQYGNAGYVPQVGPDGTFSVKIKPAQSFEGKDKKKVDCAATACFVATFNDHTDIANRDQDVWVPVTFGTAAPAAATPQTGATTEAGDPKLPKTGSSSTQLAYVGAGMLVVGVGAVAASRRRRDSARA